MEHIALLPDGTILDAHELEREREVCENVRKWRELRLAGLRCSHGGRMVWVRATRLGNGTLRVPHFRHYDDAVDPNGGCGCGETNMHLFAKKKLCDAINNGGELTLIEGYEKCSDANHISKQVIIRKGEWVAEAEKYLPGAGIRPDVLVTPKDATMHAPFVIEVFHTHKTEGVRRANMPFFEMKAGQILNCDTIVGAQRCEPSHRACPECLRKAEQARQVRMRIEAKRREIQAKFQRQERLVRQQRMLEEERAAEERMRERREAEMRREQERRLFEQQEKERIEAYQRQVEQEKREKAQRLERKRAAEQAEEARRLAESMERRKREREDDLKWRELDEAKRAQRQRVHRADALQEVLEKGTPKDIKVTLRRLYLSANGTADVCRARLEAYCYKMRNEYVLRRT